MRGLYAALDSIETGPHPWKMVIATGERGAGADNKRRSVNSTSQKVIINNDLGPTGEFSMADRANVTIMVYPRNRPTWRLRVEFAVYPRISMLAALMI